jgi:hypothetical protein
MLGELVESLILADHLDRDAMIERSLRARRRAERAAEEICGRRRRGDLSALHDRMGWAEVERIGRLLFFLRFDKVPGGASAEEIALINRIAEELQRRQTLRHLRATRKPPQRSGARADAHRTARRMRG